MTRMGTDFKLFSLEKNKKEPFLMFVVLAEL